MTLKKNKAKYIEYTKGVIPIIENLKPISIVCDNLLVKLRI